MSTVTRIPRILIADDDKNFSRRLGDFLKERGFSCRIVHSGFDALEVIGEWSPLFVIYDMMLPDINAIGMLDKITHGQVKLPSSAAFMVTSGHNIAANVRSCINAGAADFLVKPCTFEEILSRLIFQSQKRQSPQEVTPTEEKKDGGDYYLYITEMLLRKTAVANKCLDNLVFDLVKMQEMAVKAVRCSLIQGDQRRMTGKVMASSDDKNFKNFPIDLRKYPEVTAVMATEKPVAIESISQNPTMAKLQGQFKSIQFNSMIVCPVWFESSVYGVISTRLGPEAPEITDADVRFAQILAHSMGLILQKKEWMESKKQSDVA